VRGNPPAGQAIRSPFLTGPTRAGATGVLPELLKRIDTAQMVYVLPWSRVDSSSTGGHRRRMCPGQQDKFWEMRSALPGAEAWTTAADPQESFVTYAETLGLDTAEFVACLDSDWAKLRVQTGKVAGLLYGVPGAPVFLFSNGQGQQGSPSLDEFKAIIDSMVNP
jgi:hypothetical protein